MRELELFREYLTRVRQQKLKTSTMSLMAATQPHQFTEAQVLAHQAACIGKLIEDLKALESDSGEFVRKFLNTEIK